MLQLLDVFLHEALRAEETDAALVQEQLAHGTHAAGAEMVDVVGVAGTELHEMLGGLDDVLFREDAAVLVDIEVKVLVDLVAADETEVVAFVVEEEVLEQSPSGFDARGRIALTHALVDFLEGVVRVLGRVARQAVDDVGFLVRDDRERGVFHARIRQGLRMAFGHGDERLHDDALIIVEDGFEGIEIGNIVGLQELGRGHLLHVVHGAHDFLVGAESECAEERGDEEFAAFALAVEENEDLAVDVELDFEPGATVRDDAVGKEVSAGGVAVFFEADAGGTVQLADDDAFRAVDDEGAARGHHGDLAEVDGFRGDRVFVGQLEVDVEGSGIGFAVLDAVDDLFFRCAYGIGEEFEGDVFVEANNRKHVHENLLKTLLQALFRDGKVDKDYFAVVSGRPVTDSGCYNDLLYHDRRQNKTFIARKMRKGVKEASCEWSVIHSVFLEDQIISLIHVRLHTVRTHQIRIQFASRGLPLVGDRKYGSLIKGKNPALWAGCIAFPHPDQSSVSVRASSTPPAVFPWDRFPEEVYDCVICSCASRTSSKT